MWIGVDIPARAVSRRFKAQGGPVVGKILQPKMVLDFSGKVKGGGKFGFHLLLCRALRLMNHLQLTSHWLSKLWCTLLLPCSHQQGDRGRPWGQSHF